MALDEKLVIQHSLAFFKEWKRTHLKGDKFYAARDKTIENIMQVRGVADHLARDDVFMALQDVVLHTGKNLDDLSEDEFEQYVRDRLLKKQKYLGIFPLYDVFEFPSGMHIGPGIVLTFADLPANVREILGSEWDYEFEKRPDVYVGKKNEFIDHRKGCTYLRTQAEACGFEKAAQKAIAYAEDCLAIIRSLFSDAFPISSFLIVAEDGGVRGSWGGRGGWSTYVDPMADEISYWTDILTKENANDLEGRLRRAYRLHGLGATLDRPELKFIVLAVGLETMLLGKGDRDYLRHRLSEKAAFLTAKDLKGRIETYESVRALYDKRSGLVHSGLGSVTDEDVHEINRVFWEIVRAIHQLVREGYVALGKRPGSKTVDGLIEEMRFR